MTPSPFKVKPTTFVDANLINPFGIPLRPPNACGPFWISKAGVGTVASYIDDVPGVLFYQDGSIDVWPTMTDSSMAEAVVITDFSQIDYSRQGPVARPGFKCVAIPTVAWKSDAQSNKSAN